MMMLWCVFFFKHKTADEMRIGDWSSDVGSADLVPPYRHRARRQLQRRPARRKKRQDRAQAIGHDRLLLHLSPGNDRNADRRALAARVMRGSHATRNRKPPAISRRWREWLRSRR